jgi:hypothetical protein
MVAPVEYIVLEFPGNQFNGDVVPALADLIDRGVVHIIDLLFVTKDADGEVGWFELNDLDDPALAEAFANLEGEVGGLVSEDDVRLVAEELADDSSAAVIVWEDTWAERFADAVLASSGRMLAHERIPAAAVEAALAAIEADA